jgi:hypothetical protein
MSEQEMSEQEAYEADELEQNDDEVVHVQIEDEHFDLAQNRNKRKRGERSTAIPHLSGATMVSSAGRSLAQARFAFEMPCAVKRRTFLCRSIEYLAFERRWSGSANVLKRVTASTRCFVTYP